MIISKLTDSQIAILKDEATESFYTVLVLAEHETELDAQKKSFTIQSILAWEPAKQAKLASEREELEAKLKEAEKNRDFWLSSSQKHDSELRQAHLILDVLDGAPKKIREAEDKYSSKCELSLSARIAGFLGSKMKS